MDSIFKICKKGNCGITITGLEKDNDEYLDEVDEIIVSTRNYSYTLSTTLNVLTSINSQGEELILKYDIVDHTIDCIDESEMEMPIDGLYTISHIIVPNETWLLYILDREPGALDAYSSIYYYDNNSLTFMKYIDEESIEVDIEEILNVNAIPSTYVEDKVTTIVRGDKSTFCICYINECFYNICKSLLSSLPRKCINKLDDFKLLIYNRDIIWMTINVIKYLIELLQFYEAQRILEDITQCTNICKNSTSTISGGNSCGCNT